MEMVSVFRLNFDRSTSFPFSFIAFFGNSTLHIQRLNQFIRQFHRNNRTHVYDVIVVVVSDYLSLRLQILHVAVGSCHLRLVHFENDPQMAAHLLQFDNRVHAELSRVEEVDHFIDEHRVVLAHIDHVRLVIDERLSDSEMQTDADTTSPEQNYERTPFHPLRRSRCRRRDSHVDIPPFSSP